VRQKRTIPPRACCLNARETLAFPQARGIAPEPRPHLQVRPGADEPRATPGQQLEAVLTIL
jgi:hypothetical protein